MNLRVFYLTRRGISDGYLWPLSFKHKISKVDPSFLIQNKEFCGQNKKIEAFFKKNCLQIWLV